VSLNVESDRFFWALNYWVSFAVSVIVVVGVVSVVVIIVAALKIDRLEKLPMSSHLLHLRRRIHD